MSIKYKKLHDTTSNHRELLAEDHHAACGYCKELIKVADIAQWIDDDKTALCPECRIDCLMPFLKFRELATVSIDEIHKAWFSV